MATLPSLPNTSIDPRSTRIRSRATDSSGASGAETSPHVRDFLTAS